MTKRLRDWQSRFAACLAERWPRPFEWGTQDCGLFAADCVLAITGHDPAADLRGTYRTARGAARVVKRLGGMAQIGATRFGPEVPVMLAQPGDVGLLRLDDGRELLGVWAGSAWVGPGVDGLVEMRRERALMAWRCGVRHG